MIAENPGFFRRLTAQGAARLADRLRPYRILGRIAAGPLAEAIEDAEEFNIADVFPPVECFLLRVRGDSMQDAHICDGDIAIVRPQRDCENGEVTVVLVDNEEATLKTFYRLRRNIKLQPANEAMEPILVSPDRVQIVGKVVGVIRTSL